MSRSDDELVGLIIKKNQTAFAELTERYEKLIRSIIAYHLKSIPMWQEDCVNDVLFALWENMDRYDSDKNSLKNWIGAVSKYRAINYKKKFYRELMSGDIDENMTDGKDIDAELLKKELNNEIMSLLSALNRTDREIFFRRFIMEQPIDTVSESLGKKPGWIYNRISRGRKRLSKIYYLKEDGIYEK